MGNMVQGSVNNTILALADSIIGDLLDSMILAFGTISVPVVNTVPAPGDDKILASADNMVLTVTENTIPASDTVLVFDKIPAFG